MISDEMSKKFKKALRIAVNVGCGFEADAEDAAELLTLITGLESRIAELEALVDELVNIGDNLFDSLNPIAWKHEWLDKWWKLSSCRRGERERWEAKDA